MAQPPRVLRLSVSILSGSTCVGLSRSRLGYAHHINRWLALAIMATMMLQRGLALFLPMANVLFILVFIIYFLARVFSSPGS